SVKHQFLAPIGVRHLTIGSWLIGILRSLIVFAMLAALGWWAFGFDALRAGPWPLAIFLLGCSLTAWAVSVLVCTLIMLLGARAGSPQRRPSRASPQDVGVIVDPVVAALLLGCLLGLQHATDPDHLVAVATIVTRERRFAAGARVGLLWGIGHTLTLAIAGMIVVALGRNVPGRVATGLELLVAAMLVPLGVLRLRDALRV